MDGALQDKQQQCEAQEGRGSERSHRLPCQGGKLSFLVGGWHYVETVVGTVETVIETVVETVTNL